MSLCQFFSKKKTQHFSSVGHPLLYFTFSVHLYVHLFIHLSICPSVCPPVHLSVAYHISGTVHHMIIIFGTPVQNDESSRHFFHFMKILIFWSVRGVKGKKIAQSEKQKFNLAVCYISGTV